MRKIENLSEVLIKHKKWVQNEDGGERADLQEANLQKADLWEADLQEANLRGADLWKVNLWGADLREADLRGATLQGANLQGANLQEAGLWRADLRRANLRGANMDYSCWPLWCGSLDVKVDMRIVAQLAYHFCRLDCDEPQYIAARNALLPIANQFHRVDECGRLEEIALPVQEDVRE